MYGPHLLYPFICQWTQVASISWVLEIRMQWTQGCIYLLELIFLFSLENYPEVGLLGRMVVLFLVFKGPSMLFSAAAAPVHVPPTVHHILANSCYLCSFWWWPFWQVWHSISLWVWFAFPWWLVMLSILSCVCWPSVCLLCKKKSVLFHWCICLFLCQYHSVYITIGL